MKNFIDFIRTRPVAYVSLLILIILYIVMLGAPFFAPLKSNTSFSENTFHPANIEFSRKGLVVREYRVLDKSSWKYAKVKNPECIHKLHFFYKGEPYKILGIPSRIHLFGSDYPPYLLGSDNLGRDLFSRIVYGSRISLTIGFVATFLSLILALLLGGIAGFYGGKTDWSIMRLSEFFMLIPALYFILFLRSLLNTSMDSGESYMIITLILALVGWPGSARTIRGMVHSIKREEFVMNAKLEGIPGLRIIFKYIIPQTASLLIVSSALSIPSFIMSETTLSYLGLGINDPSVSWGSLINRDITTLSNLKNFPWLLYPVLMLLVVTLCFNFLADVLRDFYDPNMSKVKKIEKKYRPSINTCENLLEVKDLKVDFTILNGKHKETIHAVKGISYSIKEGEVTGILGESGSGKSVSSLAILGLLPPYSKAEGSISYKGKEILNLEGEEMRVIRGREIALIYQEPGRAFDPLQNVEEAFYEAFSNIQEITKEESSKRAIKLLEEVGLDERCLKSYAHQVSGGQLQRICIALSLAQGCRLLIADEITTALDATIQAQIVDLLMDLNKKRKLSIIFISHNIDLIKSISHSLIVMYDGRVVEKGSINLLTKPQHPYTQALLKAKPEFGSHYTKESMVTITNEMRKNF